MRFEGVVRAVNEQLRSFKHAAGKGIPQAIRRKRGSRIDAAAGTSEREYAISGVAEMCDKGRPDATGCSGNGYAVHATRFATTWAFAMSESVRLFAGKYVKPDPSATKTDAVPASRPSRPSVNGRSCGAYGNVPA